MNNKFKITGFYILIALLFSCSGMVKDFGKMNKLQDTLSELYNTKDINVNIANGKYLTVSLINTSYNDSLQEIKQKIASEIGKIVIKVYQPDFSIESGNVTFVNNNNYGIINTSKSVSFDMKIDSLLKTMKKDTVK